MPFRQRFDDTECGGAQFIAIFPYTAEEGGAGAAKGCPFPTPWVFAPVAPPPVSSPVLHYPLQGVVDYAPAVVKLDNQKHAGLGHRADLGHADVRCDLQRGGLLQVFGEYLLRTVVERTARILHASLRTFLSRSALLCCFKLGHGALPSA